MQNDSFASGEQHRKQFPYTALARWDPALRTRVPMDILHNANAGRIASLVGLKYQRMCMSPFVFLRGAAPVMAADLAINGNAGIRTQLCGDAHMQNLGTYDGMDGRLIFDINDFDETIHGPFEWDVKRMATSILLAGHDADVKRSRCVQALDDFLVSYCVLIGRLSLLPVLEAARYQVHRLTSVAPILKVLRKAERATPLRLRERLMKPTKAGFHYKQEPPLLQSVIGQEAKEVLAALPEYAESLLLERRHFFQQFRALDVAFKVVGTGSIGLRDYCVYMEGNGSDDPLFLQIKQEGQSVYASYLPDAKPKSPSHAGQRVAEGQRAMQLQSDPLLGWTTIKGQGYLVRQLNDHKAAVDLAQLGNAGLSEYGAVCGELLARGHARSGDVHSIAGYLGDGKQFSKAILTFAQDYAEQTVRDWTEFASEMKRL